ncbi:hypothetical protein L1887_22108 [Cichorium endivia]|nr:hypothetical protein L1887_22108 [Cichorium endivia]
MAMHSPATQHSECNTISPAAPPPLAGLLLHSSNPHTSTVLPSACSHSTGGPISSSPVAKTQPQLTTSGDGFVDDHLKCTTWINGLDYDRDKRFSKKWWQCAW